MILALNVNTINTFITMNVKIQLIVWISKERKKELGMLVISNAKDAQHIVLSVNMIYSKTNYYVKMTTAKKIISLTKKKKCAYCVIQNVKLVQVKRIIVHLAYKESILIPNLINA